MTTFTRLSNARLEAMHAVMVHDTESILDLYQTRIFVMPVPGIQGFVTELADFTRFIISDLLRGTVGELFQASRILYIDATDIKWHDIDSCVVYLITDSAAQIHQICRFTARKATIKPTWLQ